MDIEATLGRLAEEHLAVMSAVPWASLSDAIIAKHAYGNFTCEVDGLFIEVADTWEWELAPGGNVIPTTYAETGFTKVTRTRVIARNP